MGRFFNFDKKPMQVTPGVKDDKYQSFSTPFGQIGNGNLSLPYVNDNFRGSGGMVYFGTDNLYPQIINQMYFMSPLHSSICNFTAKAAIGGGYTIDNGKLTAQEKVDYYTFIKKLNLDKNLFPIALDLILHYRVAFKVCGESVKCRVGAEKVRKNSDGSKAFISPDWSKRMTVDSLDVHSWGMKKESMYLYEKYSVGQDIYPIPSYISAMNWIFLDGEMSYLHKSNIQNSIFPSFALMFPKKFQTDEEKQQIKDTVEGAKGAKDAGKVAVFSANGKDLLPEIKEIPTNQNDKLFIETDEQVNLKICQAHTIDPMLMGVRVSGKLGGGSDIKQAYIIWEKNVVMPLRKEIEDIINDLLEISGLKPIFKLNDFQIINETIIESVDTEANKTVDAINSMSPLVANKVLESLTPNEIRALAGLQNIKDGDIITPKAQSSFNVNYKK